MYKIKPGDRIQIRWCYNGCKSVRTPQWADGYRATVLKTNKASVTVEIDGYPGERHYVDYGDYKVINDKN